MGQYHQMRRVMQQVSHIEILGVIIQHLEYVHIQIKQITIQKIIELHSQKIQEIVQLQTEIEVKLGILEHQLGEIVHQHLVMLDMK